MSNPLVSQLPTMAVRGDAPELFTARANASLGALPQLQGELNTLSDWINTTSDAINLAKNTAVSVKDTAVAAKNTAVSVKDTAVAVKNTAVSAKDTAVAAKNDAVAAKNTAVAIAQGGNVLATDALREVDEYIQLVKGNGASESLSVGRLYRRVAVGSLGSVVTAYVLPPTIVPFGSSVDGSQLRISNSANLPSVALYGTWVCTGYGYQGAATTWKRIV